MRGLCTKPFTVPSKDPEPSTVPSGLKCKFRSWPAIFVKLRETHGQKTYLFTSTMKTHPEDGILRPKTLEFGSIQLPRMENSYQSSRNFLAKLLAVSHSKFWSPGAKILYITSTTKIPPKSLLSAILLFFPSSFLDGRRPHATGQDSYILYWLLGLLPWALLRTRPRGNLFGAWPAQLQSWNLEHMIQKQSEEKEKKITSLSILNFSIRLFQMECYSYPTISNSLNPTCYVLP